MSSDQSPNPDAAAPHGEKGSGPSAPRPFCLRWTVAIAATVAAIDQLTKWLIVRSINSSDSVPVIRGFFNLVNWQNTGAAWGMFQGNNMLLTIISVLTIVVLWFCRHALMLDRPAGRAALALIAGGIIGNLIDRLRVGAVIDFLDFHINGHRWPAFNVADSAICVGVALYILVNWTRGKSD